MRTDALDATEPVTGPTGHAGPTGWAAGLAARSREGVSAVVGDGRLARACSSALAARGRRVVGAGPGALPADVGAAILLRDGWDLSGRAELNRVCAEAGIPWLPVHTEVGEAVIGPVRLPGLPGCWDCLRLRMGRARKDAEDRERIRAGHAPVLAERPSPLLGGSAVDVIVALTLDCLDRALVRADQPEPHRPEVVTVDLTDLTFTRRRLLPEPLCPTCGALPADTAEAARIELQPRRKLRPDQLRVRSMTDHLEELLELYVDPYLGMIRVIDKGAEGGLVMAGAVMPLRFDRSAEPGFGRSRSYRTSQVTAVLEALERYGGVDPGGKRPQVRGSYRELAATALDPASVGVHPQESYAAPDFPYLPVDHDRPLWWSWGYSFARQEPLLVPETLAYYYSHRTRAAEGEKAHYYEVSNGCALGSCPEEAILHGLLEVVERDAFLLTWYTRTSPPRIDPDTAEDPVVAVLVNAIRAETGYDVVAFDITAEHGVPSVWTMAVSPDGGGPRVVCTAGANLVAEKALINALSELGPILADVIRRYPGEKAHAHEMVADPFAVRTMPDHSALYAAPEAFSRLDFLFAGERTVSLAEVGGPDRVAVHPDDLTADLRAVMARFIDSGIDVIVVDQTAPEHQAGGLSCVKVIMPGMLPMTFGHRNRRIDGLPRLLHVPYLTGNTDRPLRPEDLNPHPHPFP
jgi:ribosomal protein S12 methylthiotransferase accessory factor